MAIAAVAVALWYLRKHKLPMWSVTDAFAPGIALGHVIGRLGCLFAGCCYGRPTDVPWAITFTNEYARANVGTPLNIPLHPTQLYEAVGLGLLALMLWAARGRLAARGPGAVAAVYLLGNAAIRFGLFFLRDDAPAFAGLKVAQLIAVGIAMAALAWLVWTAARRTPAAAQAAIPPAA